MSHIDKQRNGRTTAWDQHTKQLTLPLSDLCPLTVEFCLSLLSWGLATCNCVNIMSKEIRDIFGKTESKLHSSKKYNKYKYAFFHAHLLKKNPNLIRTCLYVLQMMGTWYLFTAASKCSYLIKHGTKVEPTVMTLAPSPDSDSTLSVSTKTRRQVPPTTYVSTHRLCMQLTVALQYVDLSAEEAVTSSLIGWELAHAIRWGNTVFKVYMTTYPSLQFFKKSKESQSTLK